MPKTEYPLDYNESEKQRLEAQAELLSETTLSRLVQGAETCLEIGCGIGSNLSFVKKSNPRIAYYGVDISDEAITTAKQRFGHMDNVRFAVMDARTTTLPEMSFDFVFTRLTLWSVGADWAKVVNEAYRLLRPGGHFYAYEPDDRHLSFGPNMNLAFDIVKRWQKRVMETGLNPFIGGELEEAFRQAGFHDVNCQLDKRITDTSDLDKYKKTVANLRSIFTQKGPEFLGFTPLAPAWLEGLRQFDAVEDDSVITEAYAVVYGRKDV